MKAGRSACSVGSPVCFVPHTCHTSGHGWSVWPYSSTPRCTGSTDPSGLSVVTVPAPFVQPSSHTWWSSAKQLVDRCRSRLHLLSGRRGARALDHLMADEPPLPGRRPVSSQHVTQGRMAPPPGSRGRYRIDCCACATGHPASRLRTDPRAPMMRPVTAKMRTGAGNLRPARRSVGYVTSAETSVGVPHTCHDDGTTAVMSSHSKALQTAAGLGHRGQRRP